MSAETLGGTAGIILAIIGITPMIMISIAAIVFGTSIVIGSGVKYWLNTFSISKTLKESSQDIAKIMVTMVVDTQLLAGVDAVTFGILALIGIASLSLALIAMLIIREISFLSRKAMSICFSESLNN